MARHVRKGDLVAVISGKHKGSRGKIIDKFMFGFILSYISS